MKHVIACWCACIWW